MPSEEPIPADRLSGIQTLWSVVQRAHQKDGQALAAQQAMLDRYGNAIRRYLVASVRDSAVADDLFQEFALKFVEGGLEGVDPSRGKFRSYVKTVLFRMVAAHHRKANVRRERELIEDPEQRDSGLVESLVDQGLLQSWREELLTQAWESIKSFEDSTGSPYYTALRLRADQPGVSSQEYAAALSSQVGKPIQSGTARVTLHRAREKFAEYLIQSVAESLESPNRHAVEEELIELGLIKYCKGHLESIPE